MYGESSSVKSRRVGKVKPTRAERKSKKMTSKRNKTYKRSSHSTKEKTMSLTNELW